MSITVRQAGGVGSIDIEKYVKLSDDCDDGHHKGNEGVGNGEDPPPPGHDDNYNDGPGTSPGNPGSKNGSSGHGGSGGHGGGQGGHGDDDCGCDGHDGYGEDADSGPGLKVEAGEEVTFTYVVTNTGSTSITNVVVLDDNQTPGTPGDDFRPDAVLKNGYNVGDLDRDSVLDPGEKWLYTWTTLVTPGQHVNVAKATGTVAGGGTVTDADPAYWFGIDKRNASIGNFVWDDRDQDGIQDRDEKGIKGVTVKLRDASGNIVASSVTDSRGFYRFNGLAAGTYTVEVAQSNFAKGGSLSGWEATLRDRGSSDAKDSDGDPVTHRSSPVVLGAGQQNSDLDFGFKTIKSSHDDCRDDDRHDNKNHDDRADCRIDWSGSYGRDQDCGWSSSSYSKRNSRK